MSVAVVTFGCRLNTVESAAMRQAAEAAGLTDAVLVNTCAVTSEAVRQAKKAIRKARRERPEARIIVSGCAAEIDAGAFADMPEVDAVLGNADKTSAGSYRTLPDFGVSAAEKVRINDIMSVRETAGHLVDAIEGRARAIVEVQNGCDHRCTFCVIPFARGHARSVPMGAVVDQVRRLVDHGTLEVVLSGVDMTSYGIDLPGRARLGTLVESLLKHVPDLRRLRLSSIDSVEADAALVDVIGREERLMPHLHLSLQSGDDMILKRMKRRHSRDQAIAFCTEMRARRPDMVFGADLIAGFPTETEVMFEKSVSLVEACGLTHLHVFPYSPRAGTPAARMPPLPDAVVKARAARLRAVGDAAFRAHLDRWTGRRADVLVERGARGRLPDFTPCSIAFGEPGTIVHALVPDHDGTRLRTIPDFKRVAPGGAAAEPKPRERLYG